MNGSHHLLTPSGDISQGKYLVNVLRTTEIVICLSVKNQFHKFIFTTLLFLMYSYIHAEINSTSPKKLFRARETHEFSQMNENNKIVSDIQTTTADKQGFQSYTTVLFLNDSYDTLGGCFRAR